MVTINSIVESSANCSAAKSYFKTLIQDGMDRKKAQTLIKKACEKIKERNSGIKQDNAAARAWLNEYGNILRAVFPSYIKSAEFKRAAKGCDYKGSANDFILKYYPRLIVRETADGRQAVPVVVRIEEIDGVKFRRYRKMELTRAAAFKVLTDCTRSLYAVRVDSFRQIIF